MFDAVWFYKNIIERVFILDQGFFDWVRRLPDRTGNGYLTDALPPRTIPSFKLEPVAKGRLDLAGERGFKSPPVSPRENRISGAPRRSYLWQPHNRPDIGHCALVLEFSPRYISDRIDRVGGQKMIENQAGGNFRFCLSISSFDPRAVVS